MRRLLITAAVLTVLVAATDAAAQACTTPNPGPSFVCVNGGWKPAGHPDIPTTVTPTPAPAPPTFDQPSPRRTFWIGHRYTRTTTDIRIVGSGQLPGGVPVLFALCNTAGDGCFFEGMIRALTANAESSDWTDHGPY